MAITEVDIANMALNKIGSSNVNSLSEKSSVNLKTTLEQVRDRLLTRFDWSFAKDREVIYPSVMEKANSLKDLLDNHAADATIHDTADSTNFPLTSDDADDEDSLFTLIGEMLTDFDVHDDDAELGAGWSYHKGQEKVDHTPSSTTTPTTMAEAVTRLNDLIEKFNAHDVDYGAHNSPIDSDTKLLIEFEGGDGSVFFSDISASAHTITGYGDAQIDTDYKKFGASAGLFNGDESYISIADHADFDLSGGTWTIDLWMYPRSDKSSVLYSHATDSDNYMQITTEAYGIISVVVYDTGSDIVNFSTIGGSYVTNKWQHVEVVEDGDDWYIFVDGVLRGQTSDASRASDYSKSVTIGVDSDSTSTGFFHGSIDEFRLSSGVARHTAAFTPQTKPYSQLGLYQFEDGDASEPDFEYDYKYDLPSDYLAHAELYDSNDAKFQIQGKTILCDEEELNLKYTKQITDPADCSTLFIECWILELASELSIPLANDLKLKIQLQEELRQKYLDNILTDHSEHKLYDDDDTPTDTTWQSEGH